MPEEINMAEVTTPNTTTSTPNNTTPDTSERLNRIAAALKVLIKEAYVYGGPRKNLRQVVDVEATTTQLKIKYDDGTTQYIDPKLNRRFVILLYTKKPSRPYL
jgi:hypothetical protein